MCLENHGIRFRSAIVDLVESLPASGNHRCTYKRCKKGLPEPTDNPFSSIDGDRVYLFQDDLFHYAVAVGSDRDQVDSFRESGHI
jgi:hypothetical protein